MTIHNGLKVLAVVRSPELADALTSVAEQANGHKLDIRVGELKTLAVPLIQAERPDAVLLDIDSDDADDWNVINLIKNNQALAGTQVLATTQQTSAAAMRRLLRDGADDFIPQPPCAADLMDALESAEKKVRGAQRSTDGHGCVLSFFRSAGGMGATTIALHAAMNLISRNGANPRLSKGSVCVMDLDLQFGTMALALDLMATDGLLDIVRTPSRLDGALLRGATVVHKSGLHVLTAPRSAVPLDVLNPEVCLRLLEVARQEFAFVIVDTPQALTAWTEPTMAGSKSIHVVTQLSVAALGQTRRLLDTLEEAGHYNLPVRVVLNRYRKRWGESLDIKQAEKALNRKIDFVVANNYDLVNKALNQGVPIYNVKKRSRLGKDIDTMVAASLKKFEQEMQPAHAAQAVN